MKDTIKKITRKKFLLAGAGIPLVVTFFNRKKSANNSTVKMLTRQGTLVELSKDQLPVSRQLATDIDIRNWINKERT